MLLIGLMPARVNRRASHPGDGAGLTPVITRQVSRGQRSRSSTRAVASVSTGAPSLRPPPVAS